MAKKQSKKTKKPKTKVTKLPDMVEFKNFQIDNFMQNPGLQKLSKSVGMNAATRFKIFRLIGEVRDSNETKAYFEAKQEIIDNHDEEKNGPLTFDTPEIKELLDLDSGLKVRKLKLKATDLPGDITIDDMFALSFIIDFEE